MGITDQVQELLDRQAIYDCLQRNARGQDRHDAELMASTYHPDAIDDHGFYVGSGQGYAEQSIEVHQRFIHHQHHLTTHSVELAGDTAHAETYYLAVLREESGSVLVSSGRYIDRLERRSGEWKILTRIVTVESSVDVQRTDNDDLRNPVFYPGSQDNTDLSYLRPLVPPRQSAQEPYAAS